MAAAVAAAATAVAAADVGDVRAGLQPGTALREGRQATAVRGVAERRDIPLTLRERRDYVELAVEEGRVLEGEAAIAAIQAALSDPAVAALPWTFLRGRYWLPFRMLRATAREAAAAALTAVPNETAQRLRWIRTCPPHLRAKRRKPFMANQLQLLTSHAGPGLDDDEAALNAAALAAAPGISPRIRAAARAGVTEPWLAAPAPWAFARWGKPAGGVLDPTPPPGGRFERPPVDAAKRITLKRTAVEAADARTAPTLAGYLPRHYPDLLPKALQPRLEAAAGAPPPPPVPGHDLEGVWHPLLLEGAHHGLYESDAVNQKGAVQAVLTAWADPAAGAAAGNGSMVLEAPTGTGKTRMALMLAALTMASAGGGAVLWLTCSTDLLEQAAAEAAALLPQVPQALLHGKVGGASLPRAARGTATTSRAPAASTGASSRGRGRGRGHGRGGGRGSGGGKPPPAALGPLPYNHPALRAPLVFMGLGMLSARAAGGRGALIRNLGLDRFRVVVVDEVHEMATPTRLAALGLAGALQSIRVTATMGKDNGLTDLLAAVHGPIPASLPIRVGHLAVVAAELQHTADLAPVYRPDPAAPDKSQADAFGTDRALRRHGGFWAWLRALLVGAVAAGRSVLVLCPLAEDFAHPLAEALTEDLAAAAAAAAGVGAAAFVPTQPGAPMVGLKSSHERTPGYKTARVIVGTKQGLGTGFSAAHLDVVVLLLNAHGEYALNQMTGRGTRGVDATATIVDVAAVLAGYKARVRAQNRRLREVYHKVQARLRRVRVAQQPHTGFRPSTTNGGGSSSGATVSLPTIPENPRHPELGGWCPAATWAAVGAGAAGVALEVRGEQLVRASTDRKRPRTGAAATKVGAEEVEVEEAEEHEAAEAARGVEAQRAAEVAARRRHPMNAGAMAQLKALTRRV